MLVGFVGAPCSGKTTTAARLFAELKEMGIPAEYVAERARSYIARAKASKRSRGDVAPLVLCDEDQKKIATGQFVDESVMHDPKVVLVTDSCVLNSLLYMTEGCRTDPEVNSLMRAAAARYDLLFWCGPVARPEGDDPNRVHGEAECVAIHDQIETVIQPMLGKPMFVLAGSPRHRFTDAMHAVLDAFTGE
ncbi:hypothetical protein [Myxococcus phage Mx1]|nr:hypothetical protein [Myxococcus phage Mx1]